MPNFDELRSSTRRLAACALLAASLVAAPALAGDHLKVVFQVSEGDKQARVALFMAKRDLERDPKARIEIVAYGDGVTFLQSDTLFSTQGPKVAELAARGVVFKVCADSMRFHNLTPADFLPKVQVVPSGSLEIAKLQQQGYAYLRP